MAPMVSWTPWSLALLTLLSGCTTSPQTEPASPPPGLAIPPQAALPETAPPAALTDDSCGIEGLVMDDEELMPLAGIEVRIQGSAPRRTALDGRFSFGYLEPDIVHGITVTAEGWESQTREVTCQAGERVTDVYFLLSRPTWWGQPFVSQYVFRGRFGCGISGPGLFTSDACQEWSGGILEYLGLPKPPPIDSEAKSYFKFQMEPGLVTGAVYEMKWSHSSGLAGGFDEMMLDEPLGTRAPGIDVETSFCPTTSGPPSPNGSTRGGYPWVFGRSVLCVKFETTNRTEGLDRIYPPPTSPTGGSGHIRDFDVQAYSRPLLSFKCGPPPVPVPCERWLDPTAAERNTRLAVGQTFEVFMAFFYHGAPIPDDYAYFER